MECGSRILGSIGKLETSLVTRDQLDKCIGSSKYGIFHEILGTGNKDSSCLATFYFRNIMDVLEVFHTVPVPLPLKVKETNLGYGIWLITSAQEDFEFKENYVDATTLAGSKTVKGCGNCWVEKISEFVLTFSPAPKFRQSNWTWNYLNQWTTYSAYHQQCMNYLTTTR